MNVLDRARLVCLKEEGHYSRDPMTVLLIWLVVQGVRPSGKILI